MRTKLRPMPQPDPGVSPEVPEFIGPYRVQSVIGRGGMGTVYLVHDADRDRPVALKWLLSLATERSLHRLRFEREFRLISELSHPALVPVYLIGQHLDRPYYTMEYVPGVNLREFVVESDVAWPERLARIWSSLRGVLEALHFIHSRGVIHRDLKPENLLIDREGRLRLLDFGLAHGQDWGLDSAEQRLTTPGVVVGTVHFMAPEQVSGNEIDARSDLYSLGVILYELLSGRLPFDGPDPLSVLVQILHNAPAPLKPLGSLSRGAVELVHQLLSKEPSSRPWSAAEVLNRWSELKSELGNALYLDDVGPEPAEGAPSLLLAPSTLFSSRLVGREDLLCQWDSLVSRLPQAGRSLLLRGAAGTGKSRLVQALVSRARAAGMTVMACHAGSAHTVPYELWIRPLRWACKLAWCPELAVFQSALSVLLPNLLQPQQSDEEFDREDPTQKFHLFEGMTRLLTLAAARVNGFVLVLEDLHRTDPASLEFLQYIIQESFATTPFPWLLVSTVRGDELENFSLPHTQVIDLPPLTPADTTAVIESMLGGARIDPATASKLHEETEGNPLFLTELVKTLMTEGRLREDSQRWRLETATLPRTSQGGSRIPLTMREAIQRRLAHLPESSLATVRLAAACGQRFDFDLLLAASTSSPQEVMEHLYDLVDRRILVDERSFVFASQATVDVVLEGIEWSERSQLHRRLAEALERQEMPNCERELAFHYQICGETQRARDYLFRAAQQARLAYAFEDAADLYGRILELPPPEDEPHFCEQVEEGWADSTFGLGNSKDALEMYRQLLQRPGPQDDLWRQARLQRKAGTCWERMGNLTESYRGLCDSLRSLGVEIRKPEQSRSTIGILRLLGKNLVAPKVDPELRVQRNREVLATCHRAGRVLYLLKPEDWLIDFYNLMLTQLRSAWDARGREGSTKEAWAQAFIYGGYFSLRRLNWNKGARTALLWAVKRAEEVPPGPTRANLLRDSGFLFFLAGSLRRSRKYLEESMELSRRLGDPHNLPANHLHLSLLFFAMGWLDKSQHHAAESLAAAERTRTPFEICRAYTEMAKIYAVRGEVDAAARTLEQADSFRQQFRTPYIDLTYSISQAYVMLSQNQLDTARDVAARRFQQARQNQELPVHCLELGLLQLQAMIALMKRGENIGVAGLQSLLRELTAVAKGQRVFENAVQRLEAISFGLVGQRARAISALSTCASRAERDQNPLELALCHQALADILSAEGLADHHQAEAKEAFRRAGVTHPPPFIVHK